MILKDEPIAPQANGVGMSDYKTIGMETRKRLKGFDARK